MIPELLKPSFQCFHCKVTTQHQWRALESVDIDGTTHYTRLKGLENFKISLCFHCQSIAMWENDKVISPHTLHQPPAHTDMPEPIKSIYKEASTISRASPRASCALMRHAEVPPLIWTKISQS